MGVLVEICTGSVDDVLESEKGGANRVELCSALALGGLTPSPGSIGETKRLSKLPAMVMIRPRGGGFAYSDVEFSTMERDMEIAGELGADGFVFGILKGDGTIDARRTARLVKRASGLPTVFHRAFDVAPEPFDALRAIIDLGCTRLLTSGQKRKSLDGAELIRALIEFAENRIEVMPGGGIRTHNLAEVVRLTGCRQVHLAAHKSTVDTSVWANPAIVFGSETAPAEDRVDIIDTSIVAAIVREATLL
ncbi:MAG: copper homeostasis protein CutC [Fimbriimonas sp.]|nr:copper homeostasis protein CutC [Fimbriimonas sp.]